MANLNDNNCNIINYKIYKRKENVFWLDDIHFKKIRRLEDIIYTDITEPFYSPLALDHNSFVCLYNCYQPNTILAVLLPGGGCENNVKIIEEMEQAFVSILAEHNIPCTVNQREKLVPPYPVIPYFNLKDLENTYKIVGAYECTIDLSSNNIKEAMCEGLEKGQIDLINASSGLTKYGINPLKKKFAD